MVALEDAVADTPVTFLKGARQTGKSTLVRDLWAPGRQAAYFTLDDLAVLGAARSDPDGFVSGLQSPVILDEIQRAPELLLAIKASVDRDRRPGRFVLTGSADVLVSPRLSETLAGRMEILTLWPLSQGELRDRREGFVDALFAHKPLGLPVVAAGDDLLEALLLGGYPEVRSRPNPARRAAWYDSYLATLLERDVRDLAQVENLTAFPRLLALLAGRSTGLLNVADLSRTSGLPHMTLKRYLALLAATFQLWELPAWADNAAKRLLKSPKVLLTDTGLLAHLQGLDRTRLERERHLVGPLLENFVAVEVRKQLGWSRTRPSLFHFRTTTGREVDLVLETPDGSVVGIEVKASATVTSGDFSGLRTLAEAAGSRFLRGIVLYTGRQAVPFGENFHALPVEALWTLGAESRA